MIRKTLAILILLSCTMAGVAQDKASYKLFCPDNSHGSFGYFVGAGFNTSIASVEFDQQYLNVSGRTGYDATFEAKGLMGRSIEVGTQYIPRRGIFRMVEVAAGYRNFKGQETITAQRIAGSDVSYPDDILAEGTFDYQRISIRVSLESVVLLGPKSFLHFGPGVLIDKSVHLKQDFDLPFFQVENDAPRQETIPSLNYTLGIGFKLAPGKFLDFYAHTPLMLFDGSHKGASESIYSSNYRNMVVGVRYMWLKAAADRTCPAFNRPSSGRFSRKISNSQTKPW